MNELMLSHLKTKLTIRYRVLEKRVTYELRIRRRHPAGLSGSNRRNIELLSEQLVELENNPEDRDLLNAIFRGLHTVKVVLVSWRSPS